MPIHLIPNSWGSRLREENDCHEPAGATAGGEKIGGRFARKGSVGCDWKSPDANRTVHGADIQVAELQFSETEAETADRWLTEPGHHAEEAKVHIAETLGAALVDHPGLGEFVKAYYSGVLPYYHKMGYLSSQGGATPLQFTSADELPTSPSDAADEYESYREGMYEKASEAITPRVFDEIYEEREKAYEGVLDLVADFRKIATDVLAEETPIGPYGDDLTGQLTFPGLEQVTRSADAGGQKPPLDEAALVRLLAQLEQEGAIERPIGIKVYDGRDIANNLRVLDGEAVADAFRAFGSFPALDEQHYPKGTPTRWDDVEAMPSTGRAVLNWATAESDAVLNSNSESEWDNTERKFWEDTSELENDWLNENMMSFDDWYESQHGMTPSDWEEQYTLLQDASRAAAQRGSTTPTQNDAAVAAAFLISEWADTSGDGAALPVAMQEAAREEFDIDKSFLGVFGKRAEPTAVGQVLAKHGPFLRAFLRAMYEHTQATLPKHLTHVTLYRNFGVDPDDTGLPSLDVAKGSSLRIRLDEQSDRPPAGDIVDIRMQPMSSFASRYQGAASRFHGDGLGLTLVARVPRERIIGSARTGYGCQSEREFVVLGGDLTGYVTNHFRGPDIQLIARARRAAERRSVHVTEHVWGSKR